jgi:hypothetical protein
MLNFNENKVTLNHFYTNFIDFFFLLLMPNYLFF